MKKKKFKRHFRIYFVNNHPAYIVDEEGNEFIFHRTTHSKTSGGRINWEKYNPIDDGDNRKLYIVKKEQRDFKGRFSLFKLELKPGFDVSYPEIKKASDLSASDTGAHQSKHDYFIGRSRYDSGNAGSTQTQECRAETQTSKNIKSKKKRKRK